MIRSIRNKALRTAWEKNSYRGIPSEQARRVERILHALHLASTVNELNLPGWRLHRLVGNLEDYWSITVQANWRIIFRFVDGDVYDIDYLDYH